MAITNHFWITVFLSVTLYFRSSDAASCQRVKALICHKTDSDEHSPISYTKTFLPNFLGHKVQKEAKDAMKPYAELVNTGCSPYIRAFLCTSFVPKCPKRDSPEGPVPPCRSLCQRARYDCEGRLNDMGINWPEELDCCNFPEEDLEDRNGNCVNFEPARPEFCGLHKEVGPCLTWQARHYYDTNMGTCNVFTWGGCLGNKNNFVTREACLRTCGNGRPAESFPSCDISATTIHNVSTAAPPTTSTTMTSSLPPTTVHPTNLPPNFQISPDDVTVLTNNSVEFRCQAEGATSYSWIRVQFDNGNHTLEGLSTADRLGQTVSVLRLVNVTPDDAGFYACHAINKFGLVKAMASLTVIVAPEIPIKGSVVYLREGEDTELDCMANGKPWPQLSWNRKNGNIVHTRQNGSHLMAVIHKARRQDAGHYICQATNQAGTLNVTMQVIVKFAAYVVGDLVGQRVQKDQSATFTCSAIGVPAPVIRWRRIDRKFANNSHFTIEPTQTDLSSSVTIYTSVFRIHHVAEDDDGTYQCYAYNQEGNYTVLLDLRVVEPPKVLNKPVEYQIIESGDNAYFECNGTGSYPLAHMWKKHGDPSWPGNDARISMEDDNRILRISSALPRDSGTYICIMSNAEGRVTALAKIEVNGDGAATFTTGNNNLLPGQSSDDPNIQLSGSDLPSPLVGPFLRVKPRRKDITNPGTKDMFQGWVDVQGQGAANDFCRILAIEEEVYQLACSLAGTEGEEEFNYVSEVDFDVGLKDTFWMKDEDGDGKDDYCRCTSDSIRVGRKRFTWCTKAGTKGFYGNPHAEKNETSQYTFRAKGSPYDLRRCRKRYVDPFFGVVYNKDNDKN